MRLNADHRNNTKFCLDLIRLEGSPLKWLHNLSASRRGAQTVTLGNHLLYETKKAAFALKFSDLYKNTNKSSCDCNLVIESSMSQN